MIWVSLNTRINTIEMRELLGLIPTFVSEDDPRPAKEQFHTNYVHGGGWQPLAGWKMDENKVITYHPDDPALAPFAVSHLRDETIYVYPYSWVCIVQTDGSFEVSRMD